MGFMAGFGEGFSRQFAQSQATRAQKEQDAFRLAYSDYVDKKKSYDEADSAWKQAMSKGELMAKKYGLPPEAGLQAAKYLEKGFSDTYVDDLLSKTKYVAPDAVDPIMTPSDQPAEEAALDQTVAAFGDQAGINPASTMNSPVAEPLDPTKQAATNDPSLTPSNPDANVSVSDGTGLTNIDATKPTPPDGDILGGMFKPGGIFQHAGESDAAQAARTVRETAGISQEEFDKVNAGFTAPQIPDDPNFQISMTDPKDLGSVYERYIGKGQDLTPASFAGAMAGAKLDAESGDPALMKMAAAFKAMAPEIAAQIPAEGKDDKVVAAQMELLSPTKDTRNEVSSLNDTIEVMARDGKDLVDLAKEFDGAALTAVGQGINVFENFKQEFKVGLETINKLIGDQADEDTVLGEAERLITEMENTPNSGVTSDVAANYSEFTAKMIRYAYSVGKSYGQGGSNQSNKEFENIMKTIYASPNPVVFENNLRDLIKSKIFASETKVTSLSKSAELIIASQDANVKTALEPVLVPISKQMQANPNYAWVFGDSATTTKVDDGATVKSNQSSTQFDADGKPLIPGVYVKNGYTYIGGPAKDPSSWKKN